MGCCCGMHRGLHRAPSPLQSLPRDGDRQWPRSAQLRLSLLGTAAGQRDHRPRCAGADRRCGMTPDQLHDALYTIGWSQRDLGDRLRVDREMLRGWNQGTTEIPRRVGDWLEYLSDIHEHALLPSGWEFPVKQERADVAGEVQMSMRVVSTELGVVARETFPSGEHAYRQNHDGSWNRSPDHKGPWIVVPTKDVPERFKDAIAAGAGADKQPERAPEQQPSEAVMAISGDRTNAGTLPGPRSSPPGGGTAEATSRRRDGRAARADLRATGRVRCNRARTRFWHLGRVYARSKRTTSGIHVARGSAGLDENKGVRAGRHAPSKRGRGRSGRRSRSSGARGGDHSGTLVR